MANRNFQALAICLDSCLNSALLKHGSQTVATPWRIMMSAPFVAVLMGSDSDLPVMEATFDVLRSLDVPFEARITSAHRTPEQTQAYVIDADRRGCAVFIAAAGMAAHLAGAVAAHTVRPVIGVPMSASLDGLDALLSTVQMPAGIPVAAVAIGKAGAKNAAYLAAQVMAGSDAELHQRIRADRAASSAAVQAKDAALQEQLKA
jgi:5-(carboxyamino)imidazole ribonucleotide mutase